MATPTRKREGNAVAMPPAVSSSALKAAAETAAAAISRRGSTRSAKLSRADPTLPLIKPAWTAIASHAAPAALRCQSRVSAGTTAVAPGEYRGDGHADERAARDDARHRA